MGRLALGSTFYLLMPPDQSDARFSRDTNASQSRLMDIFPDQVVIRSRDHTGGRWLDDLTITLPRT